MTDEENIIAEQIRYAFRGVTLGNGIGLMQAEGLDDYADAATLEEYRKKDESQDWSSIDIFTLDGYCNSLAYFDGEGMRFHLPAYLIADLQDHLNQDILFHLCYVGFEAEPRFDLLNDVQREAVRNFLLLRRYDPEYDFQSSMIQNALDAYWNRA